MAHKSTDLRTLDELDSAYKSEVGTFSLLQGVLVMSNHMTVMGESDMRFVTKVIKFPISDISAWYTYKVENENAFKVYNTVNIVCNMLYVEYNP